ncbi:MAG: flagellar motor switch protein FliM [Methylomicrobium sp.]
MMSTSDLLSQEEIEMLLDGVEDDDFASVSVGEAGRVEEGVKIYDFTARAQEAQRRHIGTLERIHDRFVGALCSSLFQLLQQVPKVTAPEIQFQKFSDFMGLMPAPANLNIVKMAPLGGQALIVMDPQFVFAVVDIFFGGSGQFDHSSQGREFTRAEMKIVRKILDAVFKDLKFAWEPVLSLDLDYLGSESNPNYAAIVGADEHVAIFTVHIVLEEGKGGTLTVLIPCAMIERISGLGREALGEDVTDPDQQWQEALRNELMGAKVNVNSFLTKKTLSVKELLGLKTGDVIPIDMPRTLSLMAEGVPVLTGKPCNRKDHCALQIIEKSLGADAVCIASGVDSK